MPERIVRPVLLVSAVALFVDLFLGWHGVTVRVPGISVDAAASGWSGWGAVAGVLLVVLVLVELLTARPLLAAFLAVLAAGFAVVEALTGSADVSVAGVVRVGTQELLWPAYLGVVLAVVLGAAGVVRLVQSAGALAGPPRGSPHAAA